MRLTRDEILLVTGVLLTLVLGAAVKHYRDQHRFALAVPAASATKSRSAAPVKSPAASREAPEPP